MQPIIHSTINLHPANVKNMVSS